MAGPCLVSLVSSLFQGPIRGTGTPYQVLRDAISSAVRRREERADDEAGNIRRSAGTFRKARGTKVCWFSSSS